ncbi:MAG: cation-translocating P-type ATPase, partial [Bacteroidota bacterium]
VQKTTSAFRALSQLRPEKAKRITTLANGEEQISTVAFGELQTGDLLQINSGDRIPADGQVVQGSGETDESMISGESLPQVKNLGDALISGTLLVSGSLRMQATQVGKASTVSQIIELVKQAQADKPHIQQLADRISAVFVPIVAGIALLTFTLSYFVFDLSMAASIIHSVAVLVIACPCAMGLATPTAVVVGIGNASRKGILIKGGRTLEQLAQIKQVVFDKTGTLTTGEFHLQAIHGDPDQLDQIKGVILALEQHSSHPIAKSLREALKGSMSVSLQAVSESKGIGLTGKDETGNTYQLGSHRLVGDLGADSIHSLYLLKNGDYWAGIDLEDQIRPGAKAVIQYLKAQQIKPIMLSGDQQAKCQSVAEQLGIESVLGERLPADKLLEIEALSQAAPTAMVGDGINDAPALARAEVGISLGSATDIARQSAQAILLQEDLGRLIELHRISVNTVRTIRQNLFWAFFYNVLAIPAAAMGFLKPILATATMALSDVIVVGNSLRLRYKK